MCRIENLVDMLRYPNHYIEVLFSEQSRILPYDSVKPYHCMLTGTPLSYDYVHNTGLCTKSLHEDVYHYIIGQRRSVCFLCRRKHLSDEKQKGQIRHPREIINHFCPQCLKYFAICHRKVIGLDISFLAGDQDYGPRYLQDMLENVQSMKVQLGSNRQKVLPLPYKMIEYKPQETIHTLLGKGRGHQKKVEVVYLTRWGQGKGRR